MPLSLSASFTYLGLSNLGTKDVVYMGVGDIPDIFHRLETPSEVVPFFVLGVPASESTDYARAKGRGLDVPDGGPFLALKVLVMGWPCALFLADVTLQAGLARELEEVVCSLTARVMRYLAEAGLPVHEEAEGEGLEFSGAVIRGGLYTVSAEVERPCSPALVALRLAERAYWTSELLERIVGLRVGAAIFQRAAFAIFDQVCYEMMWPETAKTPFRLSEATMWELNAISYGAPWCTRSRVQTAGASTQKHVLVSGAVHGPAR